MTPQEAITFLKETKVGCNIVRDRQLLDVCNIAISALERQIPKKVVVEGITKDVTCCPNCTEVVDGAFCPECGQTLDWSNE